MKLLQIKGETDLYFVFVKDVYEVLTPMFKHWNVLGPKRFGAMIS